VGAEARQGHHPLSARRNNPTGVITIVPVRFPKRIRLPRGTYANPDFRFQVTIRTHPEVGSLSWPIREAIWETVLEQRDANRVQLLAACLMPDHLHLLVGAGKQDLIAFFNSWKSWSTRIAWASGHRGPLWQPSMYDVGIRDSRQFESAAEYVVANPVKAGLCERAEDWPHSWSFWWDQQ
jgi:putative transposase